MKAWILTEPGKLELQEVNIPEPSEEQVLVEIDRACSCNGSDPWIFHGHEAYRTPLVFGHEGSGKIVKAGKKVKEFTVGQKICWWFEAGAFAQYQLVSPYQTAVFEVPKNITRDECPVMELVLAACRALMQYPAKQDRKRLLICGLGPSGQVLLQYARALGYEKIVGWDLYENRRKLALSLGIDEVYDPSLLTAEEVQRMDKSDISVYMMGDDRLENEPTADWVIRATRSYGTLVSYGHPEHGMHFSPYLLQSTNLTMVCPENNMEHIREKGKDVIALVEQGKIKIEPLITHRAGFSKMPEIFENLMKHPDEYMKVIYHWEDKE